MKRLIVSGLSVLTLLVSTQTAAFAAPAPDGARAGVAAGDALLRPYGYYIARDGGRIHVEATDAAGSPAHYTGRIETDGNFDDVRLNRPERTDVEHDGDHALSFSFVTDSGMDGVSFSVDGGHWVRLALYRNGELISRDHIFVGGPFRHPRANPMLLDL